MALAAYGCEISEQALVKLFDTTIGTPFNRLDRLNALGFDIDRTEKSAEQLIDAVNNGIFPIVSVRAEYLSWTNFGGPHVLVLVSVDDNQLLFNNPAHDQSPLIASVNNQQVNIFMKTSAQPTPTKISLFHYVYDKLYPLIRWYHEKWNKNDWFTEIIPQLWLGGAPTYPRDYDFVLANGLNAVVNIRAERQDDRQLYAQNGIEVIQIHVFDRLVPNAAQIEEAVQFTRTMIEAGRTAYIHCAKGRSRSATLVAAYLMRYECMTYDQAHDFMSAKRPLVHMKGKHRQAIAEWQDAYPQQQIGSSA